MKLFDEIAPWPKTVEDVTAEGLLRYLLVAAKVWECRMVDAVQIGTATDVAVAAERWAGWANAGLLLEALAHADEALAEDMARLLWRGTENGQDMAGWVDDALERVGIEAEVVVLAYDAETGVKP